MQLTSNSEESNFVISRLRSWFKPGTRMPSVCILMGVRLLFLLLFVLELLLLLIESWSSVDSNTNFGLFVIGLPVISWPPTLSMGISVSSESSSVSTLVVSLSVEMPFWTSFFRDSMLLICALLIPLLAIEICSSPLLLTVSEFAPLTTGTGIDVDAGVTSPSPILAWLSESTDQSLFEILIHYKPENQKNMIRLR